MPERLNTKRVVTESVQGADSYVVLKRATADETRTLYKLTRAMDKADDEGDKSYNAQRAFVASHVLDWNWVWENGDAMPLPKDDPGVIGKLSDQELKSIVEGLLGPDAATLKN